jgi:hypothetical protein
MNKQEIHNHLLTLLSTANHRVYTKIESAARSGMSRTISLYISTGPGEIQNITLLCARILGYNPTKTGTIRISGCGMDMGFALVYELSSTLYPTETRPGYYLKQSWL